MHDSGRLNAEGTCSFRGVYGRQAACTKLDRRTFCKPGPGCTCIQTTERALGTIKITSRDGKAKIRCYFYFSHVNWESDEVPRALWRAIGYQLISDSASRKSGRGSVTRDNFCQLGAVDIRWVSSLSRHAGRSAKPRSEEVLSTLFWLICLILRCLPATPVNAEVGFPGTNPGDRTHTEGLPFPVPSNTGAGGKLESLAPLRCKLECYVVTNGRNTIKTKRA